jgi:hypothetical protein
MAKLKFRTSKWLVLFLGCALLRTRISASAELVPVRYREGESHAFLVLRTVQGNPVAAGDEMEVVRGDHVKTELIFRFPDGSRYVETTVFSQRETFRLVEDHLVEKGPSFRHPLDITIDAANGRVTVSSLKHGKSQTSTKRMRIPANTANGMTDILLKNLQPDLPHTFSYVTPTASPRVVHLVISSPGKDPFTAAGWKFRAIHYVLIVKIGGVAGVVAPLVGKKPPPENVWILGGIAPTFVKFQGTLYDGGPVWLIERAAPAWPQPAEDSNARRASKHSKHGFGQYDH